MFSIINVVWGKSQAPGASAALGGLCCAPAGLEGQHRLQKVLLCEAQVPVGLGTHLHLNAHTELAETTGNPTIRRWDVSSPMLEAQGRCTSCTGTHNPSGGCSQGNAWLTPAPVPLSAGAVGAVRGSASLPCMVVEGTGGVVHSPDLFGVLQSLWRTDCCGRAQVGAVITWSVCPSLHRSPQQWRCLRCPRSPSRTSLMGLPGPIMLGT